MRGCTCNLQVLPDRTARLTEHKVFGYGTNVSHLFEFCGRNGRSLPRRGSWIWDGSVAALTIAASIAQLPRRIRSNLAAYGQLMMDLFSQLMSSDDRQVWLSGSKQSTAHGRDCRCPKGVQAVREIRQTSHRKPAAALPVTCSAL